MNPGTIVLAGILSTTLIAAGCETADRKTAAGQQKPAAAVAHDDHSGHDHAHHGHAHGDHMRADDGGEKSMATAETDARIPQKTCPVMGAAIDSSIYVDHDGKRVYFCCSSCVGTFKANPEKYLRKLEQLGEKPREL